MMTSNYCNKCGLLPQTGQPVEPCKPKCLCKPKKKQCGEKCCFELGVTLIPAALGDDITGEYKAKQGLFSNMVVVYEATGASYIYGTDGTMAKISDADAKHLISIVEGYIDEKFDELDFQGMINNKLDEMVESGQLADIIAQYLTLAGVLAFDTVSDLKSAENIADGSICMCLGRLSHNDGLITYYKIRPITSGDVVDEDNIISLSIGNTLIGEKINNIRFSELQNEIDTLHDDLFDPSETLCSSNCEYSYSMKSYYSVVKIPRDFTFTIIPYSTTGYNGSYKYVNEHPNAIYINGQLDSPTVIDDVVTKDLPPDNPEYWYILGIDNNNAVKFNKDTTRLLTGTNLRNSGYKEAFGIWSPIILNGTPFTPSTELPTADSNYDYIINQKQPRSILGYDNNYWYLIVIDGRLPWSQGATFDEMVTLMQTLNITNAFNMDGGSSTQLWLSNPTTNLAIRDNSSYGRGYSSPNVVSLLKFEKEN